MIIILKKDADINPLISFLRGEGIDFRLQSNRITPSASLSIDPSVLTRFSAVEKIVTEGEPFHLSAPTEQNPCKQVSIGGFQVGKDLFSLCAGPCSVESEEQVLTIARWVQSSGATLFRGGAYKPRTSPYAFDGLKKEGLRLLSLVKKETALPVCSEIMGIRELDLFADIDVLQIGARNMQNYELLREVGRMGKPVLLKRGMSASLSELLLSAEYLLSEGCQQLMLCERGIRTFSDRTRNTLDLSAVPLLHQLSNLPIIVDPSHATGRASLVPSMALAATASGADGLIIEVHNDPLHARSDGAQALSCQEFAQLTPKIFAVRKAVTL